MRRSKQFDLTNELRVVGRTAYQFGLVAGTRSLDYRDTTDYEDEHVQLLMMIDAERYDRDIVPEWTLS